MGEIALQTLLQTVIEATDDLVFIRGLEGRCLLANSAAARCLGRLPEELVGSTVAELFPAQVAEQLQLLFYTLTVHNAGPADAEDVVVTDLLPPEVSFVGATPTQISGPNPLVWELGTLAAGQSQETVILVRVESTVSTVFTNTVTVDSPTPDPIPENDEDDETTTLVVPGQTYHYRLEDIDIDMGQERTRYGPVTAYIPSRTYVPLVGRWLILPRGRADQLHPPGSP